MLVEDEGAVALELADTLREAGYQVPVIVDRGQDALNAASEHEIDVALMDIELPGEIDGIQAAEMLMTTTRIPVVYVTAYSDSPTMERVKRSAPFGCLIKPVDPKTLHSTIQVAIAQARRVGMLSRIVEYEKSTAALQSGQFELDPRSRVLAIGGERVHLTPTESSLLEYLMANRDHVCARADIIAHVWAQSPHVSRNSVDVYVRYVRSKIREHTEESPIIAVRGKGYMFRPQSPGPS